MGFFSRAITHEQGGEGRCSSPKTQIESGIKRFIYTQIAYPYCFLKKKIKFDAS